MKIKQGYLIVTLGFFAISLAVRWIYAWFAYLDDANQHNQQIQLTNYFNMTVRDTMENWQSEFLQLAWQTVVMAESDRVEEKIDILIKKLDPENAQKLLKELEIKYPKK